MHPADEIFEKYVSGKVCVETGTNYGKAVKSMLAHGALEVRSVEAYDKFYTYCAKMFKDNSRVKLWHGTSKKCLNEMIADVNSSIVFWLDAHPCGPNTYGDNELVNHNDNNFSQDATLCDELELIRAHPVKNHYVILDDQKAHEPHLHEKYHAYLPGHKMELVKKPMPPDRNGYHFALVFTPPE